MLFEIDCKGKRFIDAFGDELMIGDYVLLLISMFGSWEIRQLSYKDILDSWQITHNSIKFNMDGSVTNEAILLEEKFRNSEVIHLTSVYKLKNFDVNSLSNGLSELNYRSSLIDTQDPFLPVITTLEAAKCEKDGFGHKLEPFDLVVFAGGLSSDLMLGVVYGEYSVLTVRGTYNFPRVIYKLDKDNYSEKEKDMYAKIKEVYDKKTGIQVGISKFKIGDVIYTGYDYRVYIGKTRVTIYKDRKDKILNEKKAYTFISYHSIYNCDGEDSDIFTISIKPKETEYDFDIDVLDIQLLESELKKRIYSYKYKKGNNLKDTIYTYKKLEEVEPCVLKQIKVDLPEVMHYDLRSNKFVTGKRIRKVDMVNIELLGDEDEGKD